MGPFSTDWEKSHGTSQSSACTANFSQPGRHTFPFHFPIRNGNSSKRSRTALLIYSLGVKLGDAHHCPVWACLNASSTPAIREDAEQPRDSLGIPNYTSVVHGLPIPEPTSQSLHSTSRGWAASKNHSYDKPKANKSSKFSNTQIKPILD